VLFVCYLTKKLPIRATRSENSTHKRSGKGVRLSIVTRFALGLALSVSILTAESSVDQLIRRTENRYNGARSLRLHFVENFSAAGRTRPAETGTLTLQKQGKMRWEYEQPAGKLFVVDGKQIYLYTASDNRVEKMPLRSTEDMRAPLAFLLGHLELKKEFRNFRVRTVQDGEWLEAEAKSDRVPYESIALLIDQTGPIREARIAGRDGSSMVFRFSNEVMNPRVDPKLFAFVPPPGAEVVDGVDLAAEGK
jgi:outer membrane lipoprotein carrier protein